MNRRGFLAWGAGLLAFSSDPFQATADGSALPPFRDRITVRDESELLAAVREAAPGDEIVVAAGEYENVEVEIDLEGHADAPLIIRAAEEGQAVFSGATQFLLSGSHIQLSGLRFAHSDRVPQFGVFNLREAEHCRISRCAFEDLGGMWGTIVVHYGASRNRIDHNTFVNCRHRAVRLGLHEEVRAFGVPVDNRIDHNIIRDIPDSGGGSAEAIALGSWGYPWNQYETHCCIENNLFLRCNGENEIITVKTGANLIRSNAFIYCTTGELVLRSTANTVVEGNRFEYCNHGIRISGAGHRVVDNVIVEPAHTGIRVTYGSHDPTHPTTYNQVHSTVVANNTVVNAGDAGIRIGDFKGNSATYEQFTEPPFNHPTGQYTLDVAPHDSIFVNNVVTGERGTLLEIIDAPDNIYSHNVLHATGEGAVGSRGDHAILEKPDFRAPAEGDYRLTEGRPGAGEGYPLLPTGEGGKVRYSPGTSADLPEVGPSTQAAAEALKADPAHQKKAHPPSSYHRALLH